MFQFDMLKTIFVYLFHKNPNKAKGVIFLRTPILHTHNHPLPIQAAPSPTAAYTYMYIVELWVAAGQACTVRVAIRAITRLRKLHVSILFIEHNVHK